MERVELAVDEDESAEKVQWVMWGGWPVQYPWKRSQWERAELVSLVRPWKEELSGARLDTWLAGIVWLYIRVGTKTGIISPQRRRKYSAELCFGGRALIGEWQFTPDGNERALPGKSLALCYQVEELKKQTKVLKRTDSLHRLLICARNAKTGLLKAAAHGDSEMETPSHR
ncbi:hypothetical protein C8J57DRAFT_1253627 [Mycena rebaudengoi]|nr:hypothetical protein C8J57DRAFT_1253627 [Mycena rebaudengoi]